MADTAEMTFRQIIREAAKEANLNRRERIKLRMALLVCPERLEQELFNQAQAEGFVPVGTTIDGNVGAFDWAAFFEFIKEYLPTILQMIILFL